MVRRNKKVKTEFGVKLVVLLSLLLLIFIINILEERYYNDKILKTYESIKEQVERTKKKHIMVIKGKKEFSLLFINKNSENIKIEKLKAIGRIENNKLIRIFDGRYGFVDQLGKIKIPMNYEFATDFIDGIAIVKKGKFGVISEKGKEILPLIYDEIFLGEKKELYLN